MHALRCFVEAGLPVTVGLPRGAEQRLLPNATVVTEGTRRDTGLFVHVESPGGAILTHYASDGPEHTYPLPAGQSIICLGRDGKQLRVDSGGRVWIATVSVDALKKEAGE